MNITRLTVWLSLVSLTCVTGCVASKPDAERLDFLMRRTAALEQQVHDLEVSNAELQKQVRALQERERIPIPGRPPLIPPQFPGVPPLTPPPGPRVPPSNPVPPLTPLDTK